MFKQSTISFALLFTFLFTVNAQVWEVTEVESMPEAVSNNAVCEGFIGNQAFLYSFGGIDATKIYSGIHQRCYRYDVQLDQWATLPDLPDTLGKIAASANRVGDFIYIIGGYHVYANSSEKSSNRVHRFDIINNDFIADGKPIPVATDDQVQVVWRDSLIYVITGWSDVGNIPNVQIYNPTLDDWLVGTNLPNTQSYKSFGSSGTIIGDTIYFFGGARSTGNFPAQAELRKGIINPANPTEITWSISLPNANRKGYRMAATHIDNRAFWIGGSTISYNFDGIAYSNGAGVPPANRIVAYEADKDSWQDFTDLTLPMDLRGLGEMSENVKYLAGGMMASQQVTNKAFRLEWTDSTTAIIAINQAPLLSRFQLFPNPAKEEIQLDFYYSRPPNKSFLQIIDPLGRVLFRWDSPKGQKVLNIQSYSSGLYFARFNVDGYSQIYPFYRMSDE